MKIGEIGILLPWRKSRKKEQTGETQKKGKRGRGEREKKERKNGEKMAEKRTREKKKGKKGEGKHRGKGKRKKTGQGNEENWKRKGKQRQMGKKIGNGNTLGAKLGKFSLQNGKSLPPSPPFSPIHSILGQSREYVGVGRVLESLFVASRICGPRNSALHEQRGDRGGIQNCGSAVATPS